MVMSRLRDHDSHIDAVDFQIKGNLGRLVQEASSSR